MKLLLLLTFVATMCYVYGEVCQNITTCQNTICDPSEGHVHLECTQKHCTCSRDAKQCLLIDDCRTIRCFDSHGDDAVEHCLDGLCKCLNV